MLLLPILIITVCLTIFVVGYFYTVVTHSIFWSVVSVFATIALGFTLWFTLWNRIRAILARRRFCKKIKHLARKNGYTLSFSNAPRKAFFKAYAGEDLILTTKEKTYYLKFFPYFTRKKNIHIIDCHHALFAKPWALVVFRHHYGPGVGGTIALTESLFDRAKKINLDFGECEDSAERVIIISPSCHSLTCVKTNGRDVIDNAYRLEDGSAFWYQDSFLTYLERQSDG